ncbi:heterodisulfide reductase-related iron-sulfur binding cluster [Micromonospora sp. LOL_025]|uniref:(Fe-S)-binding protein n=1 Tax=Micromonospora sp. LOL_025 TaxID=3345413 RepID=UPI003A861CAA
MGAYYPHRVTYHPTCHSLRMLRVADRPLRLLRAVRGLDLVELPQAEQCCGFGGTFALKNADTSTAMLADKMRHVLATGAEVCAAGDASCLMHIGGGLSRLRAGVRTVHLAEILAGTDADPLLVHLRAQAPHPRTEAATMAAAAYTMDHPALYAAAQRAAKLSRLAGRPGRGLPPPLSGWTASRDLPGPPSETFRQWWASR